MKEELIKLNAALNGLGYRNLIKMAQEGKLPPPSVATPEVIEGNYYLWPEYELVIKVNNPFKKGTINDTEMNFDVLFAKRRVYLGILPAYSGRKGMDDNFDEDTNPKFIPIPSEVWMNSRSYDEVVKGLTSGEKSAPDGDTGKVEGKPVPDRTTVPSRGVPSDWTQYAALGDKQKQIAEIWIDPTKRRPGKLEGGSYDPSFQSFVSWWYTLRGLEGYVDNVLKKLQDLNPETPAAAGATAPAAVNVTPVGQPTRAIVTPQQVSSTRGGVANITNIKGAEYYTIPAGKYFLFVRKGKPYDPGGIMMQDTRLGKNSSPRDISGSPRLREYLGSREIKRILEMVKAVEGREAVPKYEDVLKGQRLEESRLRRLFTTKKKQRKIMTDAVSGREGLDTASARQSRLDNLRKKGII